MSNPIRIYTRPISEEQRLVRSLTDKLVNGDWNTKELGWFRICDPEWVVDRVKSNLAGADRAIALFVFRGEKISETLQPYNKPERIFSFAFCMVGFNGVDGANVDGRLLFRDPSGVTGLLHSALGQFLKSLRDCNHGYFNKYLRDKSILAKNPNLLIEMFDEFEGEMHFVRKTRTAATGTKDGPRTVVEVDKIKGE